MTTRRKPASAPASPPASRAGFVVALLALLPVLLLLASCDGSPSEPPPAPISQILVASGPDARALVDSEVEVEIRVLREDGSAAGEADVSWQVHAGGGALVDQAPRVTNPQGRARATWRLGSVPSDQRLRVNTAEVTVWIESATVPDAPERLVWTPPPADAMAAGDTLAAFIQVLNPLDLPVSGQVEGTATLRGPLGTEAEEELTHTLTFMDGTAELVADPWTARGDYRVTVQVDGLDEALIREVAVRPGPPATMVTAATFDGMVGITNEPLPTLPELLVLDAFDNPVPEVTVQGEVILGAGTLEGVPFTTDDDGSGSAERWVLGPEAGENRLRFRTGDAGQVTLELAATAEPPRTPTWLAVVSGDGQTTRPGELAGALEVRVLDQDSVPFGGIDVIWAPTSGSGDIEGESTIRTDADGRSRQTTWRLPDEEGEQVMEARVQDLDAVARFTVTTQHPPEPSQLQRVSGNGQSGDEGQPLDDPLRVRVLDQRGHPIAAQVEWSVTQGGGSLIYATTGTGGSGIAGNTWTLGTPGDQTAKAVVQGHPELEVTFNATAVEISDYQVAGAYVNQATQTLEADVRLIPGRPGVFRAFVQATATDGDSPPNLTLELLQGGSVYRTYQVSRPTTLPEPDHPIDEGDWSRSYNQSLAPGDIRSGMRYRFTLDGGSGDPWPSAAGFEPPIAPMPDLPLDVRPVYVEETGLAGDVDHSNLQSYLDMARGVLPFPGIQSTIGPTFVWTGEKPKSDGDGWGELLSALWTARNAEGSSSLWYGVVKTDYGSGVAGVGYIGYPASVGYDGTVRGWVFAHEVGHNLGRRHSPCGGASGIDPDYEPSDGSVGAWGVDLEAGHQHDPDAPDFMGYCGSSWVGPHTYGAMQDFVVGSGAAQAADPIGTTGAFSTSGTSAQPSLRIWGHLTPTTLVVEPAFVTNGGHTDGGSDTWVDVELLDTAGAVLHRTRAPTFEMDHVNAASFSVAISLRALELDRVALIQVVDPATGRAGTRAAIEGAATPEARIHRTAAGELELRWDPAEVEMVVVRDPTTGAVLGFGRDGRFPLLAPEHGVALQMGDGIRPLRTLSVSGHQIHEGILPH